MGPCPFTSKTPTPAKDIRTNNLGLGSFFLPPEFSLLGSTCLTVLKGNFRCTQSTVELYCFKRASSQTTTPAPVFLAPFVSAERCLKSSSLFPETQKTLPYKTYYGLGGLPNANAKSRRFSYAISQIATLPPVVALNRSSKSQIAARYAAFWHAVSQIALASFL